jgi:hypothetical protein
VLPYFRVFDNEGGSVDSRFAGVKNNYPALAKGEKMAGNDSFSFRSRQPFGLMPGIA